MKPDSTAAQFQAFDDRIAAMKAEFEQAKSPNADYTLSGSLNETTDDKTDGNRTQDGQINNQQTQEQATATVNVLVANPSDKKDVGHTAIQIGDQTYGFYPTASDPTQGYSQMELLSSQGQLLQEDLSKFDSKYRPQGYTVITLKITVEQLDRLKNIIGSIQKNPMQYHLLGTQCTSLVVDELKQSGVNIQERINMNGPHQSIPLNDRFLAPAVLKFELLDSVNKGLVINHQDVGGGN